MKHIKLFEDVAAKKRVELKRKARKAGYDVGDTVYNRLAKRNLTVISDEDHSFLSDEANKNWTYDNNTFTELSDYCTLGAIGESPDVYSLVKKGGFVKQFKPSSYQANEKVDKLYNKVIDLIRSQEYKALNQDEYYALGIKLKKFFNDNIIE